MKSYKTIARTGCDEFIEKKSRFIGQGTPAQTEDEALAFLADLRQRYRDVSHICYAYILNMGIQRYSDAGEPSGTAGIPILETMKAQGLVDACVAVIRYFGGTLLGAGGLARAYGKAASLALAACGVITMEPTHRYWIEVSYPLWDKVRYTLQQYPCRLEEPQYTATVTVTLVVRAIDATETLDRLRETTDGRLEVLLIEEGFEGW